MRKTWVVITALAMSALPVLGQEAAPESEPGSRTWSWRARTEVRANYRNSEDERLPLRFPFPPDFIPAGQTQVFLQTVDPGSHVELSVANVQFDVAYGDFLGARAKIHLTDKYRRNPTSDDRMIDADELFLRVGTKPELLERPAGTSYFAQIGKFPKMERQPLRLLESYGLNATTFNRFEDTQLMAGGTVGRNLYWRVQLSNGNPVFFRDYNALAGDNGTDERRPPNPQPKLNSGFPTLYDAEVEDLVINTSHMELGEGLGYRWQRADGRLGFDAILYHYRRELADAVDLTGTFYKGDLALLDGVGGIGLPFRGDTKQEWGGRVYGEWHNLTVIGQATKQNLAGLYRRGYELEAGYSFPLNFGPRIGGESLVQFIQPAGRVSGIKTYFRGPSTFVAPSVWWPWSKYDGGVRVGFAKGIDLTVEYSDHSITAARKFNMRETLVTVRWRRG
jgi:hypothetical protein